MWDHGSAGWGAMAFWMFIAAAVLAGSWEKVRRNAEKHETFRRIMEKTGTVDEARLKELVGTSSTDWMSSKPGDGYRALRVAGTIFIFLAGGVALFFLLMWQTGVISQKASIIGLAASSVIGMFALGLFAASRFTEPPPRSRDEPPVR